MKCGNFLEIINFYDEKHNIRKRLAVVEPETSFGDNLEKDKISTKEIINGK